MSVYSRIPIDKLRETTVRALINLGHSTKQSTIIADTLMYAEQRANNQGLIKLIAGALNPEVNCSEIKCLFESPISAQFDGGRNIGMVVVSEAVDTAIRKAKTGGMCIVGCSNYASATGALGVWAKKIADNGLIGMVFSQCHEMVAPHGSYEPIFGTNPIAFGIPTVPRAQVLDMATSACAYFGLKVAEKEGKTIPNDIAYSETGHATTNPTEALRGALRVFDRGYKGSHLALMVELLAGALTGAAMEDKTNSKNWGSLIIAIDPAVLGPNTPESFQEQAMIMCNRVKNAKRLPGQEEQEIMLPGERGDLLAEENEKLGSIPILTSIFEDLERLASTTPAAVVTTA